MSNQILQSNQETTPKDAPNYWKVLITFAKNSLVRDLSFRTNFILQCISSASWAMMNLGFVEILFVYVGELGNDSGWGKYEFFIFLATSWIINSIVQAFFMPNAQEFSELIRTGNLDFALLKPIDTQFLISFAKVSWSALTNGVIGIGLLIYGLVNLASSNSEPLFVHPLSVLLYLFYVGFGVSIFYSLMISLAATSIWLGRNQALYNFWFYITNFCRYPMEIYQRGQIGWGLWAMFTFALPILVVINVPARILSRPLRQQYPFTYFLLGFAIIASLFSVFASRWIFKKALLSYRSASS